VHLILRHRAPNGTFEEKHLKFPPSVELDKGTHVYTAILYPSNNSCAHGPRCKSCRAHDVQQQTSTLPCAARSRSAVQGPGLRELS